MIFIKVALLCNHKQKTKIDIKKLNEELKNINEKIQNVKEKKDLKKLYRIKRKILNKKKYHGLLLTTAKYNYIDPRIIISYSKRCKNYKLPKSYKKKFYWAMNVSSSFIF